MSDRVGVVAVTQSTYEPAHDGYTITELIYESTQQVMKEAGLTWDRDTGVNSFISCSQDILEGELITPMTYEGAVGVHFRAGRKCDKNGLAGAALGVIQILSGHYDTVMVSAITFESKMNQSRIDNVGFDPIFHRRLGLDYIQGAALQATQYMDKYGISREQCAQVVVKNRENGLKNPYVRFGAELTVEDVLNSEMMAYPISAQEIKPVCDGVSTIILASEEKAKKLTDKPVWVTGMGQYYDAHNLGERELTESKPLRMAAKKAYEMAGITDPVKELSLIELSDYYAYQELFWMEELGLCERGAGGRFIESGATQLNGEIPVNPSGGLLSGKPRGVAGLSNVIDCVLQLRGEAGERQIDQADKALAHDYDGPCGQYQCVLTMEKGF